MTFGQFIAILRARFWSALRVYADAAGARVVVGLVLAKKDTAALVVGSEPAQARFAGDASHANVARRANR